LQPDDIVILNIENTDTGEILPNMAVRNIENEDAPDGRIVISTNDMDAVYKICGPRWRKAVEDYKFCYNLLGWMSKIDVSFDETTVNQWDGGSEFSVEATFTNNGAKKQIYDVTYKYDPNFGILYQRATLRITNRLIHGLRLWMKNGYPKKN